MNILDNKRKSQIFEAFKQTKEVEKAYAEGVYKDTAENRKKGRVGQEYAKKPEQKVKQSSSSESNENKPSGGVGKSALVGEIRNWNGKNYKKQLNGKWIEVSEYGMSKKDSEKELERIRFNDSKGHSSMSEQSGMGKLHANISKLSDKEYSDEDLGIKYDKIKKADTAENRKLNRVGQEYGNNKKELDNDKYPPQVKNVINALTNVKSSYKNPKKIKVSSTPKGNWRIYYDGKDTGITLQSHAISDSTVEKMGWELHKS